MLDLKKNSGLPVSLNEEGILVFSPPLKPVVPTHRTLADMRDYLADPKADFGFTSVYDMYRSVHLPQDEAKFKEAKMSYDFTVFKPGLIGKEFSKTIGHFHAKKPGTKVRYPEVYEVISGEALFLLQKIDEENNITEVYLIEAKEGEKAVFPPGFGHVTINATPQILIVSNWDEATPSEYDFFRAHRGAAYYLMADDKEKIKIVPNQNYSSLPQLVKLRPKDLPQFGLTKSQPMYQTGQKSPDMLQFLIKPELYLDKISIEQCYSYV